jgi:hypothetical protein
MMSMITPTRMVKVTMAITAVSPEYAARAVPTVSIMAEVGPSDMNSELVKSAPIGVPTMMALKA